MKPIASLTKLHAPRQNAEKPSAPSVGVASAPSAKPVPTWIDELLAKLHTIYGQKWQNHVSGIPYEALRSTWGEAISGWSRADAKRAIDHCTQTMVWPPALPDFLAAKRAGMTDEQRVFFARAESEQLALPSRTWAETRAQHRGIARELLLMLGEGERDDELVAEPQEKIETRRRNELRRLESLNLKGADNDAG